MPCFKCINYEQLSVQRFWFQPVNWPLTPNVKNSKHCTLDVVKTLQTKAQTLARIGNNCSYACNANANCNCNFIRSSFIAKHIS